MQTVQTLLVFVLVLCSPCFGFEEEVLKSEFREGILKLAYDIENSNVQENILEYFPEEIGELAHEFRRYFMGREEGYSRTQVIHSSTSYIFL